MYGRQSYDQRRKFVLKKKDWNPRFILDKIPNFDAYNDVNYLSLGLLKSKLRYEERLKRAEANSRYAGRIYSAHYLKPKSSTKLRKEDNFKLNTLRISNRKDRNISTKMSFNQTKNKNNFINNINNYAYQGVFSGPNFVESISYNNMPNYKDRKISENFKKILKEDPDIKEEFDLVNELWEKLGVTEGYVENFDFLINSKINNKDTIFQMLNMEKKQLKQFRIDLMKVISETVKRENKIKDLKKLLKSYKQVKELNEINEKSEKKDENNDENKSKKKGKKAKGIGELDKDLIEKDIHECLKSIRLKTINAANVIKNFNLTYENLYDTKINLKFIKHKYGFENNYLLKIKNDLDFLLYSQIGDLYNFSAKGGDPFLIYISDKYTKTSYLKKYKVIPISNELFQVVKDYMYSLEEEEVFQMINNNNNDNENENINNPFNFYNTGVTKRFINFKTMDDKFINEYNNAFNTLSNSTFNNPLYNTNYNSNINSYNNNELKDKLIDSSKILNFNKSKVNENLISTNFKGDVDYEKIKLKAQNEYKNVFFNTEEKYDELPKFVNKNKTKVKEENKYELPGMTSRQLYKKFSKYNKLRRELFPPYNKELIKDEVQKTILQRIDDKMNMVENEFRTKMDEIFKKEENKLKEEILRIKNEKEKIEKLKAIEDEERKQKEEKYLNFEKDRKQKRRIEKKKREENERFKKKENEDFFREMEIRFLKDLDERFRKEYQRQFELKKEKVEELEKKEKERKQEIERKRKEEYEEIKTRRYPIDLRKEEDRIKPEYYDLPLIEDNEKINIDPNNNQIKNENNQNKVEDVNGDIKKEEKNENNEKDNKNENKEDNKEIKNEPNENKEKNEPNENNEIKEKSEIKKDNENQNINIIEDKKENKEKDDIA